MRENLSNILFSLLNKKNDPNQKSNSSSNQIYPDNLQQTSNNSSNLINSLFAGKLGNLQGLDNGNILSLFKNLEQRKKKPVRNTGLKSINNFNSSKFVKVSDFHKDTK